MGKETTRNILLDAGRTLFLERGYNHSGIESILQATGVPKGSFYHYFSSKEDFGLQILERFAECQKTQLQEFLSDTDYPPLERIRRLVLTTCERLESQQCRNGCLVGNLSQEMADQSETFRARLESIFQEWSRLHAECLAEAQKDGELPADLDVAELAEFLLNSWQGAILRAKTVRNTAPLRTYMNLLFGFLLKK